MTARAGWHALKRNDEDVNETGGETGARMQMRALLDVRPLTRVDARKRRMKETRNARRKERRIIREGGNRVDRFAKVFSYGEESRSRTNFFASLWCRPLKLGGATNRAANIACKTGPTLLYRLNTLWAFFSWAIEGKIYICKSQILELNIFSCLSDIRISSVLARRQIYARRGTVAFKPLLTFFWVRCIFSRKLVSE